MLICHLPDMSAEGIDRHIDSVMPTCEGKWREQDLKGQTKNLTTLLNTSGYAPRGLYIYI